MLWSKWGGVTPTGETWVINETITSFLIPYQEVGFYITDMEGEYRCHGIIAYSGATIPTIETVFIQYTMDDYGALTVYKYGDWLDEAYRTVTFETPPTGNLLTWLQENAVKQ